MIFKILYVGHEATYRKAGAEALNFGLRVEESQLSGIVDCLELVETFEAMS